MIRALADRAVSHACAYLATVGERHVGATLTVNELRQLLGGPLPGRREDPVRVIEAIAEAYFDFELVDHR